MDSLILIVDSYKRIRTCHIENVRLTLNLPVKLLPDTGDHHFQNIFIKNTYSVLNADCNHKTYTNICTGRLCFHGALLMSLPFQVYNSEQVFPCFWIRILSTWNQCCLSKKLLVEKKLNFLNYFSFVSCAYREPWDRAVYNPHQSTECITRSPWRRI